MKKCRSVFFVFLLLGCIAARAQKRGSLILGKDHLVLVIDLHSSKNQLDSLLKAAGVNGANTAAIYKGDYSTLKKDGWKLTRRLKTTLQFNRSLAALNANPPGQPYLITSNFSGDKDTQAGEPGYPADEPYGINRFSAITVRELPSGATRFFLPGYLGAKRVQLSGSFNRWSTLKGVMAKTDSGWVADVKLTPGVYEYKYIINGRWQHDKTNLLQHPDGFNDINSVYYRYNRTFLLPGFANAHKITLAGSFNKWDANGIVLQKKGSNWETKLYLHDGMHTYRFLVDGKWIADPNNPATVKDAEGHINSVINLGEIVNFKLNGYSNAKKVYLAGGFNNWKPNEISLKKTATGWALPLIIPAGNFGYKFIVDGQWITDPLNPRHVSEGGEYNSFVAVKPNYTFALKGYTNSKVIHIAGSFNNWDPDGFTMAHTGNEWTISLCLKPGKYLYKYIIDGNWIADPANKLYEPNEYNSQNSVLWIE
ncbi:hypothetical protein [Mucilaginibacter sp. FT3.2]|uniref:hypothetical protein n=1 Tax=Mucilaginibacter sp. FT3.2 TaxID=2723090 RepID=UPI00161AF74B|nr:hypothetical protein [Mucilaginibacter sp. FT3.2]MBB6229944.1 hypothetical protein [Mucilaginibacter sp. FT3.2]